MPSQKPRFVYIMERRRFWWDRFRRTKEVKIGISNDPRRRRKEVEEGVPGRMIVKAKYRIENARNIEAYLHKALKKYNFRPKGAKRGSGRTEFFRLTPSQIREVRRTLADHARPKKPPLWVILFAVFVILLLWIFN